MERPVAHMEEFVEYHVYCTDIAISQESFAKESDSTAAEVALRDKATALLAMVEPFTAAYMWQEEAFCLKLWSSRQRERWCSQKAYKHLEEAPPHLYGRIKVGECVDDEWFVVFLLRYLSEHCPEVVVSVVDGDGDFLLIEGAYELPKWMSKPSMSVNRVFVALGRLMLIPSALGPSDPSQIGSSGQQHKRTTQLGVGDALALVLEHGSALGASVSLEKSAFRRVDEYWRRMDAQRSEIARGSREGFVLQEQHTAWAFVPHRVAAVLNKHVEFIPYATRALGFADPVAVKKCKDLPFSFPPREEENSGAPRQGKRKPALVVGIDDMTWISVTVSRLLYAQLLYHRVAIPAPLQWSQPGAPPPDDRISKGKEFGARLTVALEMLYWEGGRQRATERATAQRAAMTSAAEGSRTDCTSPGEDDDDSWLYVSPADVDDMLHEAMAGVAASTSEEAAARGAGDPSAAAAAAAAMGQFGGMTEGLKKFLSASSSYKGVEALGEGGSSGSDEDDRFYDGPGDDEEIEDQWDGLDPFASLSELREKLFKMEDDIKQQEGLTEEEVKQQAELSQFVDMMRQLDSELAGHEKLADFASPPAKADSTAEEAAEVDVDLNLAKNLVELYEEGSGAGSALPNLLHSATFAQMYDLD